MAFRDIRSHETNMTGFILAGGRSTRIGRDKAWLPVGEQTLIEVVINRIRPLVEQVVVIGSFRNRSQCEGLPVQAVLTDLSPGGGPLMGVYTGLMSSSTSSNLFVPCDMPWVEGRLIRQLMRAARDGFEAVASRHPLEGLQPFPLICHVKACRTIGALLDRGERSLQALLQQPMSHVVMVEDPALWRSFTNVNTLEDYAKLSEEIALPSGS